MPYEMAGNLHINGNNFKKKATVQMMAKNSIMQVILASPSKKLFFLKKPSENITLVITGPFFCELMHCMRPQAFLGL